MMRYWIPVLLLAIIVGAAVGLSPDADADMLEDYADGDFEYNLDTQSKTAQVSCYKGSSAYVYIPSTITYGVETYTVNGFAVGAFKGNETIVSVTSENAFSTIPLECFTGCKSLVSVNVGDALASIDSKAFSGCTSLVFQIPGSVTSIGTSAFSGCTSLKDVTVPDNVYVLGVDAFHGCTGIETVSLGSGLLSIGDRVFYGCSSLHNITIPSAVRSIGKQVFAGCDSLEAISVSGTRFASVDGVLFSGDMGTLLAYPAGKVATTYAVPDSVTKIESYAFVMPDTATLREITLNSGTEVNTSAFEGSASVVSVSLPATVSKLGDNAFLGCTSLKTINLENVSELGYQCFSGCSSLEDVTLCKSLKRLPAYCFNGCKSMTQVIIPASVTDILGYVFYDTYGINVNILTSSAKVDIKAFTVGASDAITVNTVLDTSTWDIDPSCINTVLFDVEIIITEGVSVIEQFHAGDKVVLEEPEREGFAFLGWDTDKPAVMPAENCTATALWSANIYSVAFDPNGGTGSMGEQRIVYDVSTALNPCAFDRLGMVPIGWSSTPSGAVEYKECQSVKNLVPSGSVTLYAVWAEAEYSITFDPNGGTGSMENESLVKDYGRALTSNTFVRTGYTFRGWSTTPSGSVEYRDGEVYTSNKAEDVTLYAVWKQIEYRIVFNVNGGEGSMDPVNLTYEQVYTLPESQFTLHGYHSACWNNSKDGKGSLNFTAGTQVSRLCSTDGATLVLYCIWSPNTYAIVFDADGGEGTMDYAAAVYGEYKTLPANTYHRDGYSFAGWATQSGGKVVYKDQDKVLNLTDVDNGSVTLYAVWEKVGPAPVPDDPASMPLIALAVVGVIALLVVSAIVYFRIQK